jgi:transcriptional activator of cad operon
MQYQVGDWIIDVDSGVLRVDDQIQKIEPRTLDVLIYLVKHAQEVVSVDELIEHVWDGAHVSDHAVYRAINVLRKKLTAPNTANAIETIPKKGYRFALPVTVYVEREVASSPELDSSGKIADSSQTNSASKSGKFKQHRNQIIGLSVLVFFVLFGKWVADFLIEQYERNQIPDVHFDFVLMDDDGSYKDLSYSHDGKYLLFSFKGQKDDYYQLYVFHVETAKKYRLTDSGANKYSGVWSPDSKQLAFVEYSPAKYCSIIMADFASDQITKTKSVLNCSYKSGVSVTSVSWGSIGDRLYYTDSESAIDPYRVYEYHIKTGKNIQLSNVSEGESKGDMLVSASPDGKWLAFSRDVNWGQSAVYLMNLESKKYVQLFSKNQWVSQIKWRADSKVFTFVSNDYHLYAYSVSSKILKEISSGTSLMSSPVYHPVNNTISVIYNESSADIWKYQFADALKQGSRYIASNLLDFNPVFANQSNHVAFISARTGIKQIWILFADGSLKQVTDFTKKIAIKKIAWSPNDAFILFNTNSRIYKINIQSRERQWVSESIPSIDLVEQPSWSNDGKLIYFSSKISGDWQVYSIRADGNSTAVKQVTLDGAFDLKQVDNSYYFYLKYHKAGLWKYDSAIEAEPEKLISDIDVFSSNAWFIRGSTLYYYSNNKADQQITALDLKTFKKKSWSFPGSFAAFSINATQDTLLVTKVKKRNSKVILLSPVS